MKELEETLYDFEFIPTLSRALDEHNWTGGARGRVNVLLDEHIKSPDDKEAYLVVALPW